MNNSSGEFVEFLNAACTPYHVVERAGQMLEEAGFEMLSEGVSWPPLLAFGKYYVTRNGSSIVAFTLGGAYKAENGAKIVGAHTDSPCFTLKPHTRTPNVGGVERVGVQCYGGGLWHTWFDRDLTLAGRVVVRQQHGPLCCRYVRIEKPLLRIPTLAIHLTTQTEREAFAVNKERHLIPVIASCIKSTLFGAEKETTCCNDGNVWQSPSLMRALNDAACISAEEQIVDFDLHVIDTQPATVGGVDGEFIFGPRLDNLVSCFCALKALIATADSMAEETQVRIVCLFDHEEIGSQSAQGAGGTLLPDVIEHLLHGSTSLRSTHAANSFLLSVDGAHAVHPNYPEKHEAAHQPLLQGGPVLKYNANARYATNGMTAAFVKELARIAGVPLQEFVVRNDSPCGSTIGPLLSTLTGIATADIGNPMLSMHSVREMCGTADLMYLTSLINAFFTHSCHVAEKCVSIE